MSKEIWSLVDYARKISNKIRGSSFVNDKGRVSWYRTRPNGSVIRLTFPVRVIIIFSPALFLSFSAEIIVFRDLFSCHSSTFLIRIFYLLLNNCVITSRLLAR